MDKTPGASLDTLVSHHIRTSTTIDNYTRRLLAAAQSYSNLEHQKRNAKARHHATLGAWNNTAKGNNLNIFLFGSKQKEQRIDTLSQNRSTRGDKRR